MPFLLPQLNALGDNYDGTSPLPARLERICRLDAEYVTTREIARRQRVSVMSVLRLRKQETYAARRKHLAHLAAERAASEAPLAYKGNRIALLDAKARRISDDLERNDYTTNVGIDKGGNVIEGFDTNRVGQLTKLVMAIDAMTEGRRSSTIAEQQSVAVSVTMTTDQVVTKVQALLSRTAAPTEGTPGAPLGVEGGISQLGNDAIDDGGSPQGPDQILDAKAIEVKRED